MIFWLLVSVAAPAIAVGAAAPDEETGSEETLKIDILVKQPAPECEPGEGDEIIVCAEPVDQERYRMRPIENAGKYEKDESKAEFSIAENTIMAIENEQAELTGGAQSKRLMVRVKIAF